DLAGDGGGRDDVRGREVEFAGAAAAGEVSVLRADGNRFGGWRCAGAGVDASATTGIDQPCTCLFKNFYISSTTCILLDLLRAKLKIEVNTGRDALPLR